MQRVIGEYSSRRLCRDMGKLVRVDLIPDVEKEAATRFEHPPRLGVTGDPVRKKHDAKLTNDGIECGIIEGQVQSVSLTPGDAVVRCLLVCGMIEHRVVEVRHDVAGVGS